MFCYGGVAVFNAVSKKLQIADPFQEVAGIPCPISHPDVAQVPYLIYAFMPNRSITPALSIHFPPSYGDR
jgi:hypothetical protein